MKKKNFVQIVSALFVILFVYTGISKLIGYKEFIYELKESPILKPYTGWLIWIVPGAELFIAFFLIVARWRKPALYASFFMMLLFTTYLFQVNNLKYHIPCGCGGILEKLPIGVHIILNIILAILAVIAIWIERALIRTNDHEFADVKYS